MIWLWLGLPFGAVFVCGVLVGGTLHAWLSGEDPVDDEYGHCRERFEQGAGW